MSLFVRGKGTTVCCPLCLAWTFPPSSFSGSIGCPLGYFSSLPCSELPLFMQYLPTLRIHQGYSTHRERGRELLANHCHLLAILIVGAFKIAYPQDTNKTVFSRSGFLAECHLPGHELFLSGLIGPPSLRPRALSQQVYLPCPPSLPRLAGHHSLQIVATHLLG